MDNLFNVFSVNNTIFTIMGYPMSYIELIGTILYLLSVWLIAKKNILTWPIGIVSVILYAILFYQIRLYADTFEQCYYLFASIYGWWLWNKAKNDVESKVEIKVSNKKILIITVIVTIAFSFLLYILVSRLNILIPTIFVAPAEFPFLDSLTTIMSFVAMLLLVRKRIESWIYWIIVDAIGIWLYYIKDVKFLSVLYIILLIIAIKGLVEWRGNIRNKNLY